MILFLIRGLFLCLSPKSYIGGLLVVINMMDVSGQAEVCYLHNVIFSYQDITGSHVSMNTLQQRNHTCKLIKQIMNQSHMLKRHENRSIWDAHLLGCEVFHATCHLVGAGHQVFEWHVLHRHLVGVVAVLHPRRTTHTQILSQIAVCCKLHNDVEWTWQWTYENISVTWFR